MRRSAHTPPPPAQTAAAAPRHARGGANAPAPQHRRSRAVPAGRPAPAPAGRRQTARCAPARCAGQPRRWRCAAVRLARPCCRPRPAPPQSPAARRAWPSAGAGVVTGRPAHPAGRCQARTVRARRCSRSGARRAWDRATSAAARCRRLARQAQPGSPAPQFSATVQRHRPKPASQPRCRARVPCFPAAQTGWPARTALLPSRR